MSASAYLPIDAYLQMSFEPDCDYLDGEVAERSVGGLMHSTAQAEFVGIVCENAPGLDVRPSLRMKTAPNRYRVADVAVFKGVPDEEYPCTPPLIILEIAAPDDDETELVNKLGEYRHWGVRYVWLTDPYAEKLHMFGSEGLREVREFAVPEYDLLITKDDLV